MRSEVYRFAVEMERNLQKHDNRPGWKDESSDYLLERLREELEELQAAIDHTDDGRETRILKEAADVANFAMMIADITYGLSIEDAMERNPVSREAT